MKTKEESNALGNEFKALDANLTELTDDEMKQVTGCTLQSSGKTLETIEDEEPKEEFIVPNLYGEGYKFVGERG